ncbi:hypothetical protein HZ326_23503 [Fusarium oxysporum f. sp. albedinis]|nr:hypothetical protein HZ326_23503 [Fusarium oxysporum f. sp. albedinis]
MDSPDQTGLSLLRESIMSLSKESLNLIGSSGTILKLEQTSQWLTWKREMLNLLDIFRAELLEIDDTCQIKEPHFVNKFLCGLGPDYEVFLTAFNQNYNILPIRNPSNRNIVLKEADILYCRYCGRKGYDRSTCWRLYLELRRDGIKAGPKGSQNVTLDNALYVLEGYLNLLSVLALEKKGAKVVFQNGKAVVINKGKVVLTAIRISGIYGKLRECPHVRPIKKGTYPLEYIYADIAGPFLEVGVDSSRYWVCFINDFT